MAALGAIATLGWAALDAANANAGEISGLDERTKHIDETVEKIEKKVDTNTRLLYQICGATPNADCR